ncbi:hypothetical protein DL546_009393 [Coniochaeta pulveracea]|uniref:Transcription factor domain-containing protein n=1 Tax=Coniochaeta pulveracea TaxID=177199 RepID=A0A420YP31_9PEZI|nr:hypothetical protein DL546_009393 [Coniochaeta pulveracea]
MPNELSRLATMAQISNLEASDAGDEAVTRETKRRIFWTCFIIDMRASGGFNLSWQFERQAQRPRVPKDELVVLLMGPGDPDTAGFEGGPAARTSAAIWENLAVFVSHGLGRFRVLKHCTTSWAMLRLCSRQYLYIQTSSENPMSLKTPDVACSPTLTHWYSYAPMG